MRRDIRRVIEHLCDTENPLLNRIEREKLIEEVLDETLGFGPLEVLLKDPTISDILVNGAEEGVRRAARQAGKDRRRCSATTTTCCRSSTGSCRRSAGAWTRRARWWTPACRTARRVNAVIPPIALDGAEPEHPALRGQPAEAGGPAELQGVHARKWRCSWRRASRPG